MNTKEAVAKRILELCEERNMAVNALATVSGVSPSTIYSMLNEKSKNPGVVSLKKLCDGLEISIRDFFNCELFDALQNISDSIDYERICNYSPMLLVCGWWLLKECQKNFEKVS